MIPPTLLPFDSFGENVLARELCCALERNARRILHRLPQVR